MSHHLGHGHEDGHGKVRGGAARAGIRRRLWWALGLVVLYMGAEVVGGLLSGSLALLADAGHMLSDAGSLGLALFAMWFATRAAPAHRSYGYHRAEILTALVHGGTLLAVSVLILVEAWQRFRAPPEVEAGILIAVAGGGLLVNVVGLWLLHGGREHSLNVRGAWLHVLTDALGSVQAIVAGAVILAFGWTLADPIASVVIALLVAFSAWRLTREAVSVLMEGVPPHLDIDGVREALLGVDGVDGVHDLHVWTITSGFVALSVHVTSKSDRHSDLLGRLSRELEHEFGIHHTTIQVESPGFDECGAPCPPAPADAASHGSGPGPLDPLKIRTPPASFDGPASA